MHLEVGADGGCAWNVVVCEATKPSFTILKHQESLKKLSSMAKLKGIIDRI